MSSSPIELSTEKAASSSQNQPTPHPAYSSSSTALLALSQDVTALISLSLEATASLVHDWVRSSLGLVGITRYSNPQNYDTSYTGAGAAGRGKAVVVVGANETTGQSLTLHLAKSGYTVFPLVPLPSQHSPPTSTALSSLLLTWSGVQKRLRSRNPSHSGTVVPVITDAEVHISAEDWVSRESIKQLGRFTHASETVRIYCRDNNLTLVAILCASRNAKRIPTITSPGGTIRITPPTPQSNIPLPPELSIFQPTLTLDLTPRPRISALASTDEQTLLSLYRNNVVDPLSVIKELSDLLAAGNGRVIFVNGGAGLGIYDLIGEENESPLSSLSGLPGAMKMISAARNEAARLLRRELEPAGIDVCEVIVGPMSHRLGGPMHHLRNGSDDSSHSFDSGDPRKKMIQDVLENAANQQKYAGISQNQSQLITKEAMINSRLALLSRIFAVDDALLYSSVRRAIEDRYPRSRHHAGLTPLISDLVDMVPGASMGKAIGRWVVGRLLMSRSG